MEKSLKKKVTARLPSDTYSDTFSKVHYYTITVTGKQVPSQICYISLLYVRFFGGKKKCHVYFLEFFM